MVMNPATATADRFIRPPASGIVDERLSAVQGWMVTLTNNRAEGRKEQAAEGRRVLYILLPGTNNYSNREDWKKPFKPARLLDATGMYVPGCSDAMRQRETTAQPKSLL